MVVFLSFTAMVGVSVWIVVTAWPEGGPPQQLPLTAHALALAAACAELFARVLKVKFAARSLDVPLRMTTALRVCLAGDFGSAITPARAGTEPARYFVLAQAGVKPVGALILLFSELFLEALSLGVIVAAAAFVFSGQGALVAGLIGVTGAYAAGVLAIAMVGGVLARRNASGPPPRWVRGMRIHAGHWRGVQRALRQLRTGMGGVRKARPLPLLAALVCSVAHVLLRLAALPIIVLAMAPDVDLAQLVLWPLVILYGGAVAPAPGGGGLMEVAFKAVLGGVIPAAAFVTSLLWWRFYSFYIYLLLGALVAGNSVMAALRTDPDPSPEAESASHSRVAAV